MNQVNPFDAGGHGVFDDGIVREFSHQTVEDFTRLNRIAELGKGKGESAPGVAIQRKGKRFGGFLASAVGKAVQRVCQRVLHRKIGGQFGLAMLLGYFNRLQTRFPGELDLAERIL